jgi:hypothetical protein
VALACKEAVRVAATPYNPLLIDAYSRGNSRQLDGGGEVAPMIVRILYEHEGKRQIREGEIGCQLDDRRKVIALLD